MKGKHNFKHPKMPKKRLKLDVDVAYECEGLMVF